MEILFVLKKLLTALMLPPTGPLVVTIAGLTQIRSRPRLGRLLAWTGVVVLGLLAWPPVSALLIRTVAVSEPIAWDRAAEAQAIVILGGGIRHGAAEYGGDTLGVLSLERVRYGARIARRTGLAVLTAGGTVFHGRPESEIMREALEDEFGVDVRWTEARSRDTHQNALRTAEILVPEGIRRVVLVAHAVDMRRARREFVRAGLEVVPAPTGLPAPWSYGHPIDLLPGLSAFAGSYYAVYEIVANVAERLGLLV